jgi:uncharacterized membrane protein
MTYQLPPDPTDHGDRSPDSTRPTSRLESFSDGVMAIAITALAFSLLQARPENGSLGSAIRHQWPILAAFLLSFMRIGIYWLNHHFAFKLIARTDHWANLLSLMLLLTIAVVPYPTAILARALIDQHELKLASVIYIGSLAASSLTWNLLFRYTRNRGLIDHALLPEYLTRLAGFYRFGLYGILAAFALSFANAYVGLTLSLIFTVLSLRPPPDPAYREAVA